MGDGLSSYHDGVISAANVLARESGIRIGMAAKDAARLLLRRKI
jgi:nucleotidyltransferase/DNA polymerase involved in DNA repair